MLRSFVVALAFVTVVACADDTGPEPPAIDVTGTWTFTELVQDLIHGIVCADTGTLSFIQNAGSVGGTFSQTGTCIGADTVDNAATGAVDGQVSGNNLSFRLVFCAYEATATGEPPSLLEGGVSCTLPDSVEDFNFTGSWSARRQ